MADILVLNGPNLNLLGTREPEIYGHTGLQEITDQLAHIANDHGYSLTAIQSNAEHELIDAIHIAKKQGVKAIIINPGALTHTSIALRDALVGVAIDFYEVHLSNVYDREGFRQRSFLAPLAQGIVVGFGPIGYRLALEAIVHKWSASLRT
jgi:3-dehydroquinate dehydratase-2